MMHNLHPKQSFYEFCKKFLSSNILTDMLYFSINVQTLNAADLYSYLTIETLSKLLFVNFSFKSTSTFHKMPGFHVCCSLTPLLNFTESLINTFSFSSSSMSVSRALPSQWHNKELT